MIHALALDPYLRDWLDLLVRFLHVIAAVGWIGSSFYFVLLDSSLRRPKRAEDEAAGVKGELWEVHGGGFYHVQKYRVAPPELPDHLAWFKWEAYTTWLSGFSLFVLLYWLDAKSYMIDPGVADIGPWAAVGISAALLVGAWIVYDVLCRTIKRDGLLALLVGIGVVVAAWGTGELFAPRAAWLQTGAMLGTVMAANVFFNIIPAHWELIRAKEQGREPNAAPGIEAKRRSVHNNYLTLPVLVTMLAGHFSFLTGREHAWLILVALMALMAWTRHFFNLRHQGRTVWLIPVSAAAALAALVIGLRDDASGSMPDTRPAAASSTQLAAGREVFIERCGSCHTLAEAGTKGAVGPNLDQAAPTSAQVASIVRGGRGGMPAFAGQLDADEIEAVAAYVDDATG